MQKTFRQGLKDAIPIALGYLSVSFGFGILAVSLNIKPLFAVLISLTNLTSAGQAAGVEVIATGGALIEMALTQFIINLRYSLMGLTLTQKLDKSFTTPKRLLLSFGITDEIFAVAVSGKDKISARYMAGLIVLPVLGWSFGTFLGAISGELLPDFITNAMGILLYGMFIAIFVPVCRKNYCVLFVVAIAAIISIIFKYLLPFISSGFAVIICALVAAILGAIFFPVKESEEE